MDYESFVIGGSIFVGGLCTYNELYKKTRPIIEGRIIDANFTDEDYSRIKVRTNTKDLDLILDTKEFNYGPLISFGCGSNYKGRADELSALLSAGDWIRAKVEEKQGLERRVYKLLNVYLEPFYESKIMLITDFLDRLLFKRKNL